MPAESVEAVTQDVRVRNRWILLVAPAPAFDRFKALVGPAPRLDTGGEGRRGKIQSSIRKCLPPGGKAIMKSPVPKRSIAIGGRRTAVSCEDEFWDALREIARGRGKTVAALVASIDKDRRRHGGNLSSA